MRKYLMTLIFVLCSVTVMAQTDHIPEWIIHNAFPKMPPLTVEMSTTLPAQPQTNLLLPSASKQVEAAVIQESIMLHHGAKVPESHFKYKGERYYPSDSDPLKPTRDRIVRKRREKQGNPLPPLPPSMRK